MPGVGCSSSRSSPCRRQHGGSRRASAPSAPSPSIPPTRGKSFAQRLPEGEYEFVELVERGRPDWLASACRQGVRCDLLVISGHFDSMTEFYSDRLAMRESLAGRRDGARVVQRVLSRRVLAIEGGLSLRLQHDERGADRRARPPKPSAASIRSGYSPRRCAAAGARPRPAPRREQPRPHAPHFHERARRSTASPQLAPLGPTAATLLNRYFDQASRARRRQRPPESEASRPIRREHDGGGRRHDGGGSRRASSGGRPASSSTIACRRRRKLAFIHGLLRRDMAEVRMFLDRIEGLFASLSDSRAAGAVVRAGARTRLRATTPRASATCALPRTPTCPVPARA